MPDFAEFVQRKRIPFTSEFEDVVVQPEISVKYLGLSMTIAENLCVAKKPAVIVAIENFDGGTESLTIQLEALNALVKKVNSLSQQP
jgi:hypothetical protein